MQFFNLSGGTRTTSYPGYYLRGWWGGGEIIPWVRGQGAFHVGHAEDLRREFQKRSACWRRISLWLAHGARSSEPRRTRLGADGRRRARLGAPGSAHQARCATPRYFSRTSSLGECTWRGNVIMSE